MSDKVWDPPLAIAWPHSRRMQLADRDGHLPDGREFYDTQQFCRGYANGGMRPKVDGKTPAFTPMHNRRSRRASGWRGKHYGDWYEPSISPRRNPNVDGALRLHAKSAKKTAERQRRRLAARDLLVAVGAR
jgi:hypothetical protein